MDAEGISSGLVYCERPSCHKENSGTVTQFSLHFVKSGKVETIYGSFLARMMQLRQKADYNCAYNISEKDLVEQVSLSKDFIKRIEELLVDLQY